MRKYKLIKKYPGSPKVGDIVQGKGTEGWYTKGPGHTTYDWTQVVHYPEYWEEVVELDYEVIQVLYATEIRTLFDGDYRIYPDAIGFDLDYLLANGGKIHSVKRLSDGEIFTVGDLIKTPYTEGTLIVKFQNPEANEYFIEISTGFTRLSTIEKVKKQPIFLTHDGKDIFEGHKVWYVHKGNTYFNYIIASSGTIFRSDINAYFLTRAAAEEYVEKNKVLFTTEDGVGIKHGDTYYFVDTDLKITLAPNASTGAGLYDERKYFSTYETALYYVIVNAKVLSIEEFWEFVSKPGSNVVKQKALKRLVKERLNLK